MGLRIDQITNKSTFIPTEKVVAIGMSDHSARYSRTMKFIWGAVLFVALSWLLVSCKGSSDQAANGADTVGLAAFNAQKLSDSLQAVQQEQDATTPASKQGFAESKGNGSYSEDGYSKSSNREAATSNDNSTGSASNNEVSSDESSSNNETSTASEPVRKKKKFSNAAKGALIGAGSGAVVGAVVSKKNRGLGAVIGAAVGGGAGYGIGKHKDNKNAQEGN